MGLVPPPSGMSDLPYVISHACQPVVMINAAGADQGADAPLVRRPAAPAGGGRGRLTVDGLPLIKPPYGTISAINLDTGIIEWQVAHGETPDYVRNHPALKGTPLPRTGQTRFNIGTLLTKDL